MKPTLTIEDLCAEAAKFAEIESLYDEPALYGVTDGKAVGTYLEHKFTAYLAENYISQQGNSALGIDLPALEVDIKVTLTISNALQWRLQYSRVIQQAGSISGIFRVR